MTTEQDLRVALRSLVPEDLDTTEFRARFDDVVADAPAAGTDTGPVIAGGPPRRSWWARAGIALTAAAVIVAAVGIGTAVVRGSHRESPAAAAKSIAGPLYPGTIVLHIYRGSGSRTFHPGRVEVPTHYDYGVYVSCDGAGSLNVSHRFGGPCKGGGGFSDASRALPGPLVITARTAVTWKIAVVLEPQTRTNGGVQYPVDKNFTGPDNPVRRSGRGSETVRFAGGPHASADAKRQRVKLVCHGSGVTLPGLRGRSIDGMPRSRNAITTRTCFAGFEYIWEDVPLSLPADVRVVATPGTTWTITVGVF